MRTVFVTGASGRIGRRVVPLLLNRGYRVRVTMHRTPPPDAWAKDVEIFPAADPPANALDGVDAVVHLAGLMPPAADDDVFGTNIEGTCRLLQAVAAAERKPRFCSPVPMRLTGRGGAWTPIRRPSPKTPRITPPFFTAFQKCSANACACTSRKCTSIPIVRLRFVWTLEAPEILDLFTKAPYKDFLARRTAGMGRGTT